jgi:hypothetical protein
MVFGCNLPSNTFLLFDLRGRNSIVTFPYSTMVHSRPGLSMLDARLVISVAG